MTREEFQPDILVRCARCYECFDECVSEGVGVEALVPDKLRPCPRCGGEANKSMYFDIDEEVPMGWEVSVYCGCGLRSPRESFIGSKEEAVDQLRDLIAWWNERPIEETQTDVRDPRFGGADGRG